MFTDKELFAFRNIKAPDNLREKIIGKQKTNKNYTKFIAAVAACFILVISVIAINNTQNNIVVNGQKLTDSLELQQVSSSMQKTRSSTVTVAFQFKVNSSTTLSVSDGTITFDSLNLSKELVIDSPKEVLWQVEPSAKQCEFEMLITDKKGVQKVTLKYDNAKITLTKEKEK